MAITPQFLSAAFAGINIAHSFVKELTVSKTIQQEELPGRINEVLMAIGNVQMGLIQAQDEIRKRDDEIHRLKTQLSVKDEGQFVAGAWWTRETGPFCQLCWSEGKKVVLVTDGGTFHGQPFYQCPANRNGHADAAIPLPEGSIQEVRKILIEQGKLRP